MAWPTAAIVPNVPPLVRYVFGPNATDAPTTIEPVRRFNDQGRTTDRIVTAIGKANQQFGITIAAIVRVRSAVASNQTILAITDSSPTGQYILRVNASGELELESNAGSHPAGKLPTGDAWHFIAVAEGLTGKPHFWVYDLTNGAWITKSLPGNNELGAPLEAKKVCFGEDGGGGERGLPMDIAAAAVWSDSIETAEVEELIEAGELAEWGSIPVGGTEVKASALWFFGQANVSVDVHDLTANGADETSITGTEVLSESAPIPYGDFIQIIQEGGEEGGSKAPTEDQLFPRSTDC